MKTLNLARMAAEIALVALVITMAVHLRTKSWTNMIVYRVPTKAKVVALTYDDGPHPKFTPELLKILDKYGIKATFFMIGREMNKHPEIVKEAWAEGHVIANHTYTHPHNIAANSSEQVIRELEDCEKTIERLTGRRAHLFRPPRGLMDGTVFTIAEEEGYRTILWTVCADHHNAPTPELMAQRVLKHIRPGAIILAHDGSFDTRWKDVAATPLIIEGLHKKGYRFVTIPELLKMAQK